MTEEELEKAMHMTMFNIVEVRAVMRLLSEWQRTREVIRDRGTIPHSVMEEANTKLLEAVGLIVPQLMGLTKE